MLDPFDSLPCIIMMVFETEFPDFFSTTSIHQLVRTSGDSPQDTNGVPIAAFSPLVLGDNRAVDSETGAAAKTLYRSWSSLSVRVDNSGIVCFSCLQKVAIVVLEVVLVLPQTVKSGTLSCKIQSSMSSHFCSLSSNMCQ